MNNPSVKSTDRVYLIGLILIAITFIACVISFWLLYYGSFIFAIGACFVFLSKRSLKTKILTTILPIFFYLPTTYFFLLAYNYSTPKIFLIPADYDGTIRIIFEEKCGESLQIKNGRQIFNFPENGILILNEKFDGHINHEYYLVDKNGKQTKVEQTLNSADKHKTLPYILVGSAGTIGDESGGIAFSDFYLYNKDTLKMNNLKVSQQFDSLTIEIVKACRIK